MLVILPFIEAITTNSFPRNFTSVNNRVYMVRSGEELHNPQNMKITIFIRNSMLKSLFLYLQTIKVQSDIFTIENSVSNLLHHFPISF